MSFLFKPIFKVLAVFLCLTVFFGFWPASSGGAVKSAAAVNLWGDYFSRTVGQKGFDDIGMGRNDPRVIATNVVNFAFGLLGVVAIALIMYGGYLWMMSAGDPAKIEKAKGILANATIGLLIILSAFALAIYILMRFVVAVGSDGKLPQGRGGGGGVLAGLGGGIIKSVYPVPEQKDVPRNTSIIVTFREPMDPATICDQVVGGFCAPNAKIVKKSIKIYKTDQGDTEANNLTDVLAFSKDNRTFVFAPSDYLGSASEKIWYTVALTGDIKRANGQSAFTIGGFEWKFEVSNVLDLIPPQVLAGGVWPAPDNGQDTVGSTKDAVQAEGTIIVRGQPQVKVDSSVSYVKNNPGSVELTVAEPKNNSCDGQIDMAVNNTSPLSVSLAYRNMAGKVDVPQAAIIDRQVITACNFKITLDPGFVAGQAWTLNLVTAKQADNLLVGSTAYTFVSANPKAREIAVAIDPAVQAANIASVLAGDGRISAQANGATVNLKAKQAGASGNNIALLSSADYTVLAIAPLSGGADKSRTMNKVDKEDKPKNTTIQINFNEALNPLTASGPYESVANYLKVINVATNDLVKGDFILSNQYQTVEFIPSEECGVNGCGETVYCLPANTEIRVELKAAALAATCATADECARRAPFTVCTGGLCTDQNGLNYPEGQMETGLLDLANNSLDGNRDGRAVGPLSLYNENNPAANQGDSFSWSFWVSDQMDLTAPRIMSVDAANGQNSVALDKPISIQFSKRMLGSSLNSGSSEKQQAGESTTHKLINLWSRSQEPLGYWVEKFEQEASTPPDNEADYTVALIKHALFNDSTVYRAQVGSGVKDIYQNCYKPSSGPDCEATDQLSSCCLGVPGQVGSDGNCQ